MTLPTRVDTEPNHDIRVEIVTAFRDFRQSGWKLAEGLAIVANEEMWRGWNFASFNQWLSFDFSGKLDRNGSHYLKAGRRLLSADEVTRAALLSIPVWSAIEAERGLEKPETRESTMRLLAEGATTAAIRSHVARVRTDLHQTTEHRSVVVPNGTGMAAVAVDQEIQQQWARLMNVAAYFCEKASPSIGDKVEWVVATLLNDGYQNMLDTAVVARWAKYGLDIFAEIEEGRILCLRCGCRDIRRLQGHHYLPRSLGGKHGPVGLVCMDCHEALHRGQEWQQFAEAQGIDVDAVIQAAANRQEPFVAPAGEEETNV